MVAVCVLTSVHRWNDPRVYGRQALALADAGHDVRVVAPGAEPGEHGGVTVEAVRSSGGRLRRMTTVMVDLARASSGADVVHVHDPELLVVLMYLRARRRDVRLVYDAHEDYRAQIAEKEWIPSLLRGSAARVFGALEVQATKLVDLVIAATPHIARRFDADKTVIVQNTPRIDGFPPVRAAATEADDVFSVVHLGELNPRRGARTIEAAAALLPASRTISVQQRGPVKPADLLSGATIECHPQIAPHRALAWAAEGDAGIVLFQRLPNHEFSQPNKLFEYLALGLPVVASDFDHWRRVFAGFEDRIEFVDPDDPRQVAEAFERIARRRPDVDRPAWAERARERYDWRRDAAALIEAYRFD